MAYKAGIAPAAYWDCAFDECLEAMQAYERRQVDEWERTREITWMIYAVNVEQEDRKSVQELWPLPGDEPAAAQTGKQDMVERWKKMGYL